jgi:hypothetical protein
MNSGAMDLHLPYKLGKIVNNEVLIKLLSLDLLRTSLALLLL